MDDEIPIEREFLALLAERSPGMVRVTVGGGRLYVDGAAGQAEGDR